MNEPTQASPGLPPLSERWQRGFAWIEAELGGRIVRAERQPRWRPAWFLDLERDGEILPLYFRGDRGAAGGGGQGGAYALEHELEVLRILERQGVLVPHVHGFCEEPRGIVMERSPGRANLATAEDEKERVSVLEHYMEILAQIHAIDPAEFASLGLTVPRDARALGLADFDVWERGYRKQKRRAEPVVEFLIQWVRRNVPADRHRPSFICADAGQFLFDRGRVTGVIDLELATLGDPVADLGAMLGRDLSEPLGPLSTAFEHYAKVTGKPLDHDAIDFHAVRFCSVTPIATAALVAAPSPETDLVQYLTWYLVYQRAPIEIIGRRLGVETGALELPDDAPTRHTPAHEALARMLEPKAGAPEFAAYESSVRYRVAEYLRRADRMGAGIEAQDLDEVESLLGKRPRSWAEADVALEKLVEKSGTEREPELVRYFHRRLLRQEAILRPVMNELEGVSIQHLSR